MKTHRLGGQPLSPQESRFFRQLPCLPGRSSSSAAGVGSAPSTEIARGSALMKTIVESLGCSRAMQRNSILTAKSGRPDTPIQRTRLPLAWLLTGITLAQSMVDLTAEGFRN